MVGPFVRFPAFVFACLCTSAVPAAAHGVVGARFFPATLTTDDPFAADELSLPTVSVFRHLEDGAPVTESEYSTEYSKTLWRGFAISFEDAVVHVSAPGEGSETGFANLAVTPALEIVRSDEHEFIASASLTWEIGGTGSKRIGADTRSSFTPALKFGKGFGDLPDAVSFLRPLAVTGVVGYTIPGHSDEPHTLEWGGALEYSLAYLQTNVRDVGLGSIVVHMTPVVEFALSSPLGRHGGKTTGTVDPGLVWSGQKMQFGVEAVLPVNGATGSNVGFIAQLHFYMDDIFPHSLGTPLFGNSL